MEKGFIKECLAQNPDAMFAVSAEDLKEFAMAVIEEYRSSSANEAEEQYLTVVEVMKMIGITRQTLKAWEKRGLLHPVKVGCHYRYQLSEIKEFDGRK